MGGEEALEKYNICIGTNLTCMNNFLNQMGQFDHVEHHGQQMKCRYVNNQNMVLGVMKIRIMLKIYVLLFVGSSKQV